jgi:transposase, IS6 family
LPGSGFPPEVITVAVRWYLRYSLSYRDIEELLAERGIEVDHVTIYRWVQRFTPLFAEAARPLRHATGERWFVDETYVKVAGRWRYLYRAVDQSTHATDPPRPQPHPPRRRRPARRRGRRPQPCTAGVTAPRGGSSGCARSSTPGRLL